MCFLFSCAPSEPIYPSKTQCLLKFLSLPWPLRVPAVLMVSTYLLFNFPVQKLCEPRFFLEPQLLPLRSPCCQAPARGKVAVGRGDSSCYKRLENRTEGVSGCFILRLMSHAQRPQGGFQHIAMAKKKTKGCWRWILFKELSVSSSSKHRPNLKGLNP